MPDYVDLSVENGWIPEPTSNEVLTKVTETSAVMQGARVIQMTSDVMSVPRFEAQGVEVVPEHAEYTYMTAELGEVDLKSRKFGKLFQISWEDSIDSVVDALNQAKAAWLSNDAVHLDNAVLGATGVPNGTTVPFESVYRAAGAGNREATAGALTYEQLSDAFGDLDEGIYAGNTVVFAHPAFKRHLRNLKDEDGVRVADNLLGGEVPTLFGSNVLFTRGAVASATASDAPSGNPLLIVANRKHLILGNRISPQSQVSDQVNFKTDHIDLKMRARRAFALATPDAVRVIELTAAAA